MYSARREFQWNVVVGISSQLLSLIINMASKKAIQTFLGIEYMGLQSIFGNFCNILTLTFTSTGIALLLQLYHPFCSSDQEKLTAVYCYFDKIYHKITVLTGILGLGATVLVLIVVNADIGTLEVLVTYYLYLLSIIVYNRYSIQNYYIMADQKRYVVCLVNSAVDFLALMLQIIILYLTHNYGLFLVCILSKNLLINGILTLYRRKKYPYLGNKHFQLEVSEKCLIQENIRDTVTYRVGKVLLDSTDSILISALVNTGIAGCYSNYLFISNGVRSLISGFFDSVRANVGQNICRDTLEKQYEDYKLLSFINICIMAVCTSGVYWLTQDFITLWMNRELLLPNSVVMIVAVNLYMSGIRKTSNVYRQGAGIFQKIGQVVILRGILNMGLSILLGLQFGLMGILVSTTISNVLTVYWFEPYLLYRYFHKSFMGELLFQAAGVVITLMSVWLCGAALSLITGVSWPRLFLKAGLILVVCAVWLGFLTLLYFRLFSHRRNLRAGARQGEKEDT